MTIRQDKNQAPHLDKFESWRRYGWSRFLACQ